MQRHNFRQYLRSTAHTAVLLGALGATVVGCMPQQARFAAVLPLTGVDQPYGESLRRGLELAADELHQDGQSLVLEILDSESRSERARELAAAQYGAGALAVVGGVSAEELASLAAEAERAERVLLTPAVAALEGAIATQHVFRVVPPAADAATQMASFAKRSLKAKTAVLVIEERTFAGGLQDAFDHAFAAAGGKVVETIAVPSVSDAGAVATRIAELRPDAVYLAAHESSVATVVRELKAKRFKGSILTTNAFARQGAIAELGKAASGVLMTRTVLANDTAGPAQDFTQAYRERYGEEPDVWAAYGYDALRLAAAALKGRPPLPSELRKGLRDDIRELPGVTGVLQFDERGNLVRYPRVYMVTDDLEMRDYSAEMERRRTELQAKLDALQRETERIVRRDA